MLKTRNISVVPVVDDHRTRRFLGTLSDRDLVTRCLAEGKHPWHTRADSLMILAGLSAGLSFLILPLGLIGLLLAPVWSLWLGVVMLRQPTFAVVRRPRRFGRLDS